MEKVRDDIQEKWFQANKSCFSPESPLLIGDKYTKIQRTLKKYHELKKLGKKSQHKYDDFFKKCRRTLMDFLCCK